MKLIVGLGNPGEKYERTRHNLGFMVLDELLEKFEPVDKTFWDNNKNLKSELKLLPAKSQKLNATSRILLAKPTTFMNNSGFAVSKVLSFYKIAPFELIVIHDDLDLPFGKIRVRFGGASGGHRGVESIINVLGTDKFLRVRLGIGKSGKINDERRTTNGERVSRYVLSTFASNERGKVKTMIKETLRTINLILKHGIEAYMSKYNR